jgi:hypothetical protein
MLTNDEVFRLLLAPTRMMTPAPFDHDVKIPFTDEILSPFVPFLDSS